MMCQGGTYGAASLGGLDMAMAMTWPTMTSSACIMHPFICKGNSRKPVTRVIIFDTAGGGMMGGGMMGGGGGGYGAAPAQAARPGMGAGTAGMLGAGGGLLGGMMLGEALEGQ